MDSRTRTRFWAIGVAFLVLGVAGLFLPILQGILFLLVGLAVLSRVSDRAAGILAWARSKVPDDLADRSREIQEEWTRKLEGEEA